MMTKLAPTWEHDVSSVPRHFTRIQDLQQHYRQQHSDLWEHVPLKAQQLTNIYSNDPPCGVCGALFRTHTCPVWTQIAMLLVNGACLDSEEADLETRCRCDICGECFETPAILTQHLQQLHGLHGMTFNASRDAIDNSAACAHCGQTFTAMSSLKTHIVQGKCVHFNPMASAETKPVDELWKAACLRGQLYEVLTPAHNRLRLTLHCQCCPRIFMRANDLALHLQSAHSRLWRRAQRLTLLLVDAFYSQNACCCNPSTGVKRGNHVCLPLRQLAMAFHRLQQEPFAPTMIGERQLQATLSPKLPAAQRFLLEQLLTNGQLQALWTEEGVLQILRACCLYCGVSLAPADLSVHLREEHQCHHELYMFYLDQLQDVVLEVTPDIYQCPLCTQIFNLPWIHKPDEPADDRMALAQSHLRGHCPVLVNLALLFSLPVSWRMDRIHQKCQRRKPLSRFWTHSATWHLSFATTPWCWSPIRGRPRHAAGTRHKNQKTCPKTEAQGHGRPRSKPNYSWLLPTWPSSTIKNSKACANRINSFFFWAAKQPVHFTWCSKRLPTGRSWWTAQLRGHIRWDSTWSSAWWSLFDCGRNRLSTRRRRTNSSRCHYRNLQKGLILQDRSFPYHRWDPNTQKLILDKKTPVSAKLMGQQLEEILELLPGHPVGDTLSCTEGTSAKSDLHSVAPATECQARQGLRDFPPSLLQRGVDGGGSFNEATQPGTKQSCHTNPESLAGQPETGQGQRQSLSTPTATMNCTRFKLSQVLCRLIMNNDSTWCYANCIVFSLMWTWLCAPSSTDLWGCRFAELLQYFCQLDSRWVVLAEAPWFQQILRAWGPAHGQNDSAEFTQAVLAWLGMKSSRWHAMGKKGFGRHHDTSLWFQLWPCTHHSHHHAFHAW